MNDWTVPSGDANNATFVSSIDQIEAENSTIKCLVCVDLEKIARNLDLDLIESKEDHERGQYSTDFDDFCIAGSHSFRFAPKS